MRPRPGRRGGDGLGRESSAVGVGVEKGIVQPDRTVERQGEGIEQQLFRIEPQALLGAPWPVSAQAIERAGAQVRREAVKDRPGAARQGEAGELLATARVEQA